MRFLTRVHAIIAFAVCTLLYLAWVAPSLRISKQVQEKVAEKVHDVLKTPTRRVVVFGDSWSDTGAHRVGSAVPDYRDPEQGRAWTEVLCEKLKCDELTNLARSASYANLGEATGAVVSNYVIRNLTVEQTSDQDQNQNQNSTSPDEQTAEGGATGTQDIQQQQQQQQKVEQGEPLDDFKAQVERWLKHEDRTTFNPLKQPKEGGWTTFTVMFGIWDLWHLSRLQKDRAAEAIDRIVEALFEQLDVLAQSSAHHPRFVMPLVPDISFLPGFVNRPMPTATATVNHAQDLHLAVYLVQQWNAAIGEAAVRWTGGELYMPDLNEFIVEQVRNKQLNTLGMTDANGLGKEAPIFQEVLRPCIMTAEDDLQDAKQLTVSKRSESVRCNDSTKHLFWDNLHLSSKAHELIGTDTAAIIAGNETYNHEALNKAREKSGHLDPGYFNAPFPPS